jgi:glycosyltransferase involved in cell wall biosynthesis
MISTYNRARHLSAAIESVFSQSYRNTEIIVVNDGSTDGTDQVCSSYGDKIRYVRQDNYGLGFARERALKLATGRIFAWLDDDDRWLPQKVERIVDFFEANPDCPWLHSDAVEVNADGRLIHESYLGQFSKLNLRMHGLVFEEILVTCFPLSSTVAMRRECLTRLGGFFTSESYGVDLDLYTRAAIFFPLGFIPEALVQRTLHDVSDPRTNSVYDEVVRCTCRIPVFRRILEGDYPLTPAQRRLTQRMLRTYHFRTAEAYLSAGQPRKARPHYRLSSLDRTHALRASVGFLRCVVQGALSGPTSPVAQAVS